MSGGTEHIESGRMIGLIIPRRNGNSPGLTCDLFVPEPRI
jgi:hypothetical protein